MASFLEIGSLPEIVYGRSKGSTLFENADDLFSDFVRGKIVLKALIKKVGGIGKIATKRELEQFLKNKFMIDYKADEMKVTKQQLIKKINQLLGHIKRQG